MPITDWPEGDRPREKLLAVGAKQLTDTELLAIFLRTGIPGKTAVDLAREVLTQFGSLRAMLRASQAEFSSLPGLGPAKYAQLQAVVELSRRFFREELPRTDALNNPSQVRNYLRSKLRDYQYEVFGIIYLDNQNRIITFEELFRGSISSASVYPREVVRQVLRHNAAATILVHNHPSGISEPSQADRDITQTLADALRLVEVRVLDHLIVGDVSVVSMAERGLL